MPNRTTRLSRISHARFPILAIALTLLATLSGCGLLGGDDGGSSEDSGNGKLEKSQISVGVLPVVDVGPLFLAIEKGYFKEQGLDVKPVVLDSGPASINGILSGDIDVGFGSYPAPLTAQSKGAGDLKIISEALVAKPGHITMVAPPNSPIKKPQDVPGKKIAISGRNSFTDLAPMAVLESQNVDHRNVQWVEMGFPDMLPAMQNGDVDGAVVVEPWRTVAEKQLGANVVLDGASGPTAEMPMSGYAVDGKFAEGSPNTVKAFQRGLAKAQAEAADRSKIEPMLVKHAKIEKDIAPLMTIATYSTSLNAKRVQRVADLLQHFNVINKRLEVSSMVID